MAVTPPLRTMETDGKPPCAIRPGEGARKNVLVGFATGKGKERPMALTAPALFSIVDAVVESVAWPDDSRLKANSL